MSNGEGFDGDGLYMRLTNPALASIYYSTFVGNEGNGIELENDIAGNPLLSYVSYFGNDTDLDSDLNFYSHASTP